jgi:hypothetical protein
MMWRGTRHRAAAAASIPTATLVLLIGTFGTLPTVYGQGEVMGSCSDDATWETHDKRKCSMLIIANDRTNLKPLQVAHNRIICADWGLSSDKNGSRTVGLFGNEACAKSCGRCGDGGGSANISGTPFIEIVGSTATPTSARREFYDHTCSEVGATVCRIIDPSPTALGDSPTPSRDQTK